MQLRRHGAPGVSTAPARRAAAHRAGLERALRVLGAGEDIWADRRGLQERAAAPPSATVGFGDARGRGGGADEGGGPPVEGSGHCDPALGGSAPSRPIALRTPSWRRAPRSARPLEKGQCDDPFAGAVCTAGRATTLVMRIIECPCNTPSNVATTRYRGHGQMTPRGTREPSTKLHGLYKRILHWSKRLQ